MQFRLGSNLIVFAAGFVLAACSTSLGAQRAALDANGSTPSAVISVTLPDAPTPQLELASAGDSTPESQSAQQPSASSDSAPSASSGPPQNSSGSQTSTQPPAAQQSQHDKAAAQIKEQEKQRIAGILPSFNVTYRSDAVSMTASQKISLAFRSAIDPYAFGVSFIVAGFSELQDQGTGFGWGPEGYFKRSGAAYLDAFDGAMIGNGFLPALLHQDPRYFRLGHGSFHRRFFYAVATSYICKHDNTGKWEPNYSNVGGNIIAGAISNLYYPSQTAGLGQTIDNGLIVTTEGTVGGVLQEFWPDISRKLFHKDPTHGLDAQAAAADKAAKAKKKAVVASSPAAGGTENLPTK
jgi:hypothetical protein